MLRDGRLSLGLTQAQVARRAGVAQSTWSWLESGAGGGAPLSTWTLAATAANASLDAYIRQASAASQPRDAVHLRNQELVIRIAHGGGWRALPEARLGMPTGGARWADVIIHRPAEYAVIEIFDWFDDVGSHVRDFARRTEALDRLAVSRMPADDPVPRVSGCWVVRATRRNRQLLAQHSHFFRARFPGSGRAWLAALQNPESPMPHEPAILWVSSNGERLLPVRWPSR
jgi:transcriptional regulator with XRE-family HTH domain